MGSGLQISVQASKDYLRIDKIDNNKISRIAEKVYPDKILQRDVKAIAELVRQDIENNLKKGIKYTGGKVAPLRPATIKRKGHSRVFLETGKLFRSIQVKKVGSAYVVGVKEDRADIMKYLQEGDSGRMKPRPAFGITKKKLNEFVTKVFKKKGSGTKIDVNHPLFFK
jgi:hypothetical protein